ncbi:tRNA-splicing endonuclease subunit [Rhynchospora pubera]|uniref:tRNA-splicing endonuclease subunit n=1 Tax=Rhynchospora pubera TaxID=906938 RepID=A0AAV8DWN0_9POAL|nr:tRNA-splicing endonuclease subunit [Rhynchospora pubera]
MDGEEVSKVEGETRRQRKGRERGENQERSRQLNSFLLEDDTEEIHFNPFLPSSPNSNNSPLSGSQIRTEVSKARWVEEIGMAQVIEKKGSLWVSTGVIRNSKLYCHIEEIGHLKSLGYIVGRQGQPWSLKHNKINRNSDSTADTDLIAGRIEELQIGAANLVFDIHQPNSKFKKTDPGNPSFIICLVGDRPPSRKEVEDLEKKCKSVPLKFCHVSHDNVSFFSFPKVSLSVLP